MISSISATNTLSSVYEAKRISKGGGGIRAESQCVVSAGRRPEDVFGGPIDTVGDSGNESVRLD
jgi:hypothetical protein